MDTQAIQRTWDAQQESYMPDREDRLASMLDIVEATTGPGPCILDLACGTGTITRRLLSRLPGARAVLVDIDPVLLAIAEATFDGDDRALVVHADLEHPGWTEGIPAARRPFDAVLTATALHWLPATRVAALYGEAAALLRSGGVFGNADHMPDPGLPELSSLLAQTANERAVRIRHDTGATDWTDWWTELRDVPELAAPLAARDAAPPNTAYSKETSAWHVSALRDAGFAEAGLVWRGHLDALVVGVNPVQPPSRPR